MKKASGGNWRPPGNLAGGKFLQEIAAKLDQSVREIDFQIDPSTPVSPHRCS